jgi:hypothetical protein
MRRVLLVAVVAIAAAGLAACGERPQELAVQKSGKYQGKPDSRPWDNAQFNNNKGQWEAALKARNQNQNEYTRVE